MSEILKPSSKTAGGRIKAGATYRGILLQPPGGHTRFTPDQIREAVVSAIAKNTDAFVRKA